MDSPTVVTDRQQFETVARNAPAGARVPVECRVTVDDPFLAYRRARDGPGGVYLATTGGQQGWGYFGVDPTERLTIGAQAMQWSADTSRTDTAGGVAGFPGLDASPTLAALQARVDGETLVRGDCTVPYPCGLIGWLSYDIARELESLPETTADTRGLPRAQFGLFDRLAAWEEPRDDLTTLHITACPRIPAETPPATAYNRGRERALALVERIRSGDPAFEESPSSAETARFESECGPEAFEGRVQEIKARIRDGETFQTNISQRLRAPAAVHPVAVFDALRTVNPAPYSALLEYPAADLVSASPELLLDRSGGTVRTEPIAGTRPRGATDAADADLEAELLADTKERAEHAMLVDLERNDLGKVATYGSVSVTEYRRVDRYSEVMHLVSLVEGTLQETATLADVIAAMFPGGTITGAPKPRTMELIETVETTRRGPYTGSIGILGFDDRATLNIIIRTLVRTGGDYYLRVGAGIVHDSKPQQEYNETLDKAQALITAVDTALGADQSLTIVDTTADD